MADDSEQNNKLNDEHLLRYSRHILLDDFGVEGQIALSNSKVLIIGAGGLGCPAAAYLAACGVGQIHISDDDTVDLSNLQRQILHSTKGLGQNKAASAVQRLHEINPEIVLTPLPQRFNADTLGQALHDVDVVLDCSDNAATRYAVNAACVNTQTALVWASALGWSGQMSCYLPPSWQHPVNDAYDASNTASSTNKTQCACYACIFPPSPQASLRDQACATFGVFAPLTGVIGSMLASEAVRLLIAMKSGLSSRFSVHPALANTLLLIDGKNLSQQSIRVHPLSTCTACGEKQEKTTNSANL